MNISDFGFRDGVFRTWSPDAEKVEVLLFKNSSCVKNNIVEKEFPLTCTGGEAGVWESSDLSDFIENVKYYKYRFTFKTAVYEVCDIWAKCACSNSAASQLTDIKPEKYFNPFGASGKQLKKYSDAVIYEMHIRDWCRAFYKNSTGKFTELAESKELFSHLKELGVTHVQLLPFFDYASKDEDSSYNWGYDPYNFNVPESRYANSGYEDGTDVIFQLRQMIQAFHDNGIAVNMDVVYNHTHGTKENSIYDMTAPGYFYRLDGDGNYFNGSGCGNEIASNKKLVRDFIIDSLKHWMTAFHINGFRFDLMGVFEASTMKEIYEELYKIDPNVMIYAEPWCGGSCGVENGCCKENIDDCSGVACFNDNFRNAIKGPEFGGFGKGQVQGQFCDSAICTGLTGSLLKNGGFTQTPLHTINYAECHDNYTLFDKLAISYLGKTSFSGDLYRQLDSDGMEQVKKWNKLSAAYVILSQGIPFLNGGQEFMRTKKGDENSYVSSDEINQIDLDLKKLNEDVFNTYKGLLALRRQNPAAFGCNYDSKAVCLCEGVTLYETENFVIYFNASQNDVYADEICKKYVDVKSGAVFEAECTQENRIIQPSSFKIFKK